MQATEDTLKNPDLKVLADWGRQLVRDHPDELTEPNFSSDGNALAIWSRIGFVKFQEWMISLGKVTCQIDGKTFETYPEDSHEDQLHIATTAFRTAKVYWSLAKGERDLQIGEARKREEIAGREAKELEQLRAEIAAEKTLQALEHKQTAIRDQLSTPGSNRTYLHQQLDIVQTRLIELEKANGKTSYNWGVAGFVVGALGLLVGAAFPINDIMHRPEPTTQRDCPATPTPPATNSTTDSLKIEPAQK
jgi:hypothetical protein